MHQHSVLALFFMVALTHAYVWDATLESSQTNITQTYSLQNYYTSLVIDGQVFTVIIVHNCVFQPNPLEGHC